VATFTPDELEPATNLWDLASGAPLLRLEAPWPLFSPDGKHLLLGGARLLDTATWQDVASLERKPTAVATFDPKGTRLLVGREDGSVALWDLGRSSCSWATQIPALHGGQPPPIRSVWLAPDGAWGYAVTASEVLRLVLSDGRLWDRSGFLGSWRVAATPDGSRLFGISLRGQRLRHFDLAYRQEIRAPYEHEEAVLALDVASDGALAVTAGAEGTARLWSLQDGYHIRSFPLLTPRAVALSSDGRRVLLVDSIGAHLHDSSTGEHLASFRGFQRKLTRALAEARFLPDGAVLLRDEAHLLVCWDPASDRERWRQDAHACALQVAEDGASVWVTTDRGTLELRDLQTGAPRESYLVPDRRGAHRQQVLPGEGSVLCVQAGVGLTARPLESGKAQAFYGAEGVLELLAVSPHGSTVLAREAGAVSLWDVREGGRIQWIDLSRERDEALCGAFLPDGDGFLVGTARGVVLSYRRG
jgi:WD40 repeat protein